MHICCSDVSLKNILTDHAKLFSYLVFAENYQFITVRQKHIWEDTK